MSGLAEPKIADGSAIEVQKSPNDKKLYRYMILENGLRVLLISDPEMDITPAASAGGQVNATAMNVEGLAPAETATENIIGAKAGTGKSGTAAAKRPAPATAVGSKRARGHAARAAAKADVEECSGDLESDSGDEDEDAEEDEDSGSGDDEDSEDEEMASAGGSGGATSGEGSGSAESSEGDEADADEGEAADCEGEEGGRGGRRKKGSGGAGKATVKKAAAAMAVGVGSFSDPEDLQGLSHYLEHMLFMGSAKYPEENHYDDYLTRHGGSANAFTELESTNYHFEVAPTHLAGALDRFAQFFIAPLCNEGSMEREVLAVDSEFSQVLQDDQCRLSQIMCHTARPGHIYRKFSWGNKTSLEEQPRRAGIDVRQRLLEHYRRHYGADRSCLVVLGGEDPDVLARMVTEAFGAMPASGPQAGPRPSFAGLEPPFQGRSLHVIPAVRDNHELHITFQLPPLQRLYGSKSDSYISHLLGHEGPGSLLSALKARGWASEIMAGVDDDGYSTNSCCSLFGVDVTLTEAGLRAGPGGCGLAVAGLVFGYIDMMRREGPQEWVWQEMKAISELRWRFLEEGDPMDTVSRLAGTMHHTAPQHALVSEYLHETWDPALVESLLDRMVAAAAEAGAGEARAGGPVGPSYRVDLLTRQYDEVKSSVLALASREGVTARVESEPWFGLEVVVMELPDRICREWAQQPPLEELRLPPRNPYLPSDFSLRCEDPGQAAAASATASDAPAPGPAPDLPPGITSVLSTPPALLLDQPGLRLWHKMDSTFRTPRAAVHWRLFSPAGHTDPRVAACGHLTLKLVEEALREDAYLADVAGLHYHTSPEGLAGMEFRVDGFSDKLGVLVGRLAGALAALALAAQPPALAPGAPPDVATQAAAEPQPSERAGADGLAAAAQQPPAPCSRAWLAAQFGSVREALLRRYRNMNMEVGQHSSYSRLFVLCARAMHCDDILRGLETLTPEDIPPFVSELLARCHVEAFVHGNVTASGARELAAAVVAAMGPGCCMGAAERVRDQCVVLPAADEAAAAAAARPQTETEAERGSGAEGEARSAGPAALDVGTAVGLQAKNPKEENAAVEVYYQLGAATEPRDRAVLDLIDQILYEPCYDSLRTKQQLGYSVYSGARLTNGISGFCIHVVSARHPPTHLDACIETFLAAQGPRIRGMTPGELATHSTALVAAKLQRDRNLVDEAARLWAHISSQRYDFLSRELEVAALESVTVEEVYDTYVRYFLPPSVEGNTASQRRKLSVQVAPHKPLLATPTGAEADAAGGPEAEAAPMAVDGSSAAAVPAAGRPEQAPVPERFFSEPGDLLALRSGLKLHPLQLGTPPKPLLQD